MRVMHEHLDTPIVHMLRFTPEATIHAVKQAIANEVGVPASALRLRFGGRVLGRRHRHDYLNLEKERTLGQHRVFQWLARFPDWSMDADLLLELPEPLPGERAPCGMDKLIHSIGGPLKDEELK